MRNKILIVGMCTCTVAPMGEYGLEGYSVNFNYKFEKLILTANNKEYFRLYPVIEESGYYECCDPTTFKKYFKQIGVMER